MKLYEIANEYKALENAIENDEIPAEALVDTLESVGGEFNAKVENIACLVKSLEADAKAIKEEVKALQARAKAKESKVEWLRSYLSTVLESMGKDGFDSAKTKISFRPSEETVIDKDHETELLMFFNQNYEKFSGCVNTSVTFSKSEIKKHISNGEEIPFCSVIEKNNIQIK